MAVTVSAIRPVAHLPLILGMLRKLEVATIIDDFLPPHPDNVLSGGRGVEALVLAILDGHHALYKVGTQLEDRGKTPEGFLYHLTSGPYFLIRIPLGSGAIGMFTMDFLGFWPELFIA